MNAIRSPLHEMFVVSRTVEIDRKLDEPRTPFLVTPLKKIPIEPTPRVSKLSIKDVLSMRPESKLVVNNRISVHDLQTLQGRSWLNDSILNYYLELLVQESSTKFYAFNSFFLPKLHTAGHEGVKRWTKSVDVFSHRIILWVVHAGGNHWCLALADNPSRTLFYFDSLGGSGDRCLRNIQSYLFQEHMVKHNAPVEYRIVRFAGPIPQQANGFDCGVFTLSFARDIVNHYHKNGNAAASLKFTFAQQDMPSIRQRITQEIIDSHQEEDDVNASSDSDDDLIML